MVEVQQDDSGGAGPRVGIAVARFNEVVTERLLEGAMEVMREEQIGRVVVEWVPGAFELPLACRWLGREAGCDAVVMLGAIVRGGTDHYDYVCSGVTDGALRVQLEDGLPLGFGVLTCQTMELALARAGGDDGNKGRDAAMAALAMLRIKGRLRDDAAR